MPIAVQLANEAYIIRMISKTEQRAYCRLSTSNQCQKYLDLIINKSIKVNDYIGRANELQILVGKIKGALNNGR